MRFRYSPSAVQFTDGGPTSTINRPVIRVEVSGPTGSIRLGALIDSGADCTIFPRELADTIGVDLNVDRPTIVSGIDGSEVEFFSGDVDLELKRKGETVRWKTKVPFGGSENFLLGQLGFFEFFTVTFDHEGRSVEVLSNARIAAE